MTDSSSEFEKFWNTYQWPEAQPIFYRLYHDDAGNPIVYTMEDLPGKYVEVTQEQYQARDHRVWVRDGQVVSRPCPSPPKLQKSDHGTPCHPTNAALTVTVDEPHIYWNLNDREN